MSAEQLREEIAESRGELGETVEALTANADVKGQAKAKEAALESAGAGAGAQQIAGRVEENPIPIAIAAAFGAGVVVGWLLGR